MNIWRCLQLILMVSVLSACSAMSDKECLQADWSTVGQLDAEQGRVSTTRLEKYYRSCADVSVVPDKTQYEQGYQQGLQQFCTQSKGYYFGLHGGQYKGTCHTPATDEASFMSGYQPATERYKLERRVDELERLIAKEQTRFLHRRPLRVNSAEHAARDALQTHEHYQALFWLRMERQDVLQALRQWETTHQTLMDAIHGQPQ